MSGDQIKNEQYLKTSLNLKNYQFKDSFSHPWIIQRFIHFRILQFFRKTLLLYLIKDFLFLLYKFLILKNIIILLLNQFILVWLIYFNDIWANLLYSSIWVINNYNYLFSVVISSFILISSFPMSFIYFNTFYSS